MIARRGLGIRLHCIHKYNQLTKPKIFKGDLLLATCPYKSWNQKLVGFNNSDLAQQDGGKTQDGRMTYKNVAQDQECIVSRHIFSSFRGLESYRRPVA